ncbi:MAG: hypothetical protein D6695_03230 [Planctomycetota bacterium]|nr:MAG: hypothetical protein D6695_03230 [Planctomycetota bacterium]
MNSTLSAAQADMIKQSFGLLSSQAAEIVDQFYDNLFKAAPGVRSMFPSDMTEQKRHLLSAIKLVVQNADRLHALEAPLNEMGARHVGYGAKPEHYPVVRDTLLATLAEIAGNAWTDEIQAAWTEALNLVAAAMLRGAEGQKRLAA